MGIELLFILVLILANGILAMAEIAVVSARRARLQQLAEEGDLKAKAALDLRNDPADFLSSVQIGITLVGVLAGAFGGATIAEQISIWVAGIPVLAPYSAVIGVILVVVLITYFTLVLGELVPKRLALNNPERAASAIAMPMQRLSRLTRPAVRLLSISSDFVLRVLGARPSTEPPVTEEEIKVLIEQGTQADVFAEAEQDMVEAIFRLGDRRVGTLMTPRTEVIWIDLSDPLEAIRRKLMASNYSRFPVAEGGLDNVVGLIEAKEVLASCLADKPLNLRALMHTPLYIPESMLALNALEKFRESRMHIALVIDEFGGFQGLVTLFDVLESIVGDIPEIGELAEPEVVLREDGTWLVDGMLPVDEFKEVFDLDELPEEDRGYYQTVGGFVMTQLGQIPSAGDYFDWLGLRFEVVDMDGMRVDKILVSPVEEEQ